MDTWIDKVLKIVVALGYMLAIILAMFLFIIALWTIGGWVI
jgi:hypothetical protein